MNEDMLTSQELSVLQRITRGLTRVNDPMDLLNLVAGVCMEEFGAERTSIFLRQGNSRRLKLVAGKGLPPEVLEKKPVAEEKSISHWVARNKAPLVLNGPVKGDPRFRSRAKGNSINSALVLPMIFENKVIGVLSISRVSEGVSYNRRHLRFASILSSQAAAAIEISYLQQKRLDTERMAAIGKASAEIFHSMKNILTGLEGGLSLAETSIKKQDWERLKKGHDIVSYSVGHLSKLTRDLLDYGKTKTPTRKCLFLYTVFRDIVSLNVTRCKSSGVRLVTQPSKKRLAVLGDAEELHKAFFNIVENALDVMPEGGELLIRWEKDGSGENAFLEIKDTGTGIAADEVERIFQPFYTNKGSGGTGLGLSICKKIIEAHGGKISVSSVPGQGTAFTISLPVVSSNLHPLARAGVAPPDRRITLQK